MSGDGARLDVVTVGESLGLVSTERSGPLHNSSPLRLGFGGAESNVAIGVARLGGQSAWVGRLGSDAVGELIERELRAENVRVYVVRDEHHGTAMMLKHHRGLSSSRVSYYRRHQAGSQLGPADLPPGVIESATILHVTGITPALGELPRSAITAAVARARAAGTTVSFDVNHRRSLWADSDDPGSTYRQLARHADIVFAGEDEAELVTGHGNPRAALQGLLVFGARCAVLKRGAKGAMAVTADGAFETADALPVPVVDTVGAGDAFVAGWLTATARSLPFAVRMRTAIACGAWACTNAGDWEGTPTRDDLEELSRGDSEPVMR